MDTSYFGGAKQQSDTGKTSHKYPFNYHNQVLVCCGRKEVRLINPYLKILDTLKEF